MRFWSISTTIRNPERIRSFLAILKKLEHSIWTKEIQRKYQVLLIQNKIYGFGVPQFEKSLTEKQLEHLHSTNFSFSDAQEIAESKNYEGGLDMRGRQSFNPLEKMGLAYIDTNHIIHISEFGNYFLDENYDLGEVFFRSFIKWQYPNPDAIKYKSKNYSIKPFIATLHLIQRVNQLCEKKQMKIKGVSKIEFALFFVSLSHFQHIQETAKKLIDFRIKYEILQNQEQKNNFRQEYFSIHFPEYESWKNAVEYTDNIIRYFRLTRYLYLRGGDFYIDLEPHRKIEIDSLIASDSASSIQFSNKQEYISYIGSVHEPQLPWETKEMLISIINGLQDDIIRRETNFSNIPIVNTKTNDVMSLKQSISQLREFRRNLNNSKIRKEAQQINTIEDCISSLQNIFSITKKRPVELERLVSIGLNALNDALEIKPNFPVGDDNKPIFTAPANKPDIECFYNSFNAICEVTLLTNRSQWYNEGQPVMRHVRDFENKNTDKNTYCLFIAPKLHKDTLNTFWIAVKYEYEGFKQKIIPITIRQFTEILQFLITVKQKRLSLSHKDIKNLFDAIIGTSTSANSSLDWIKTIPDCIKTWRNIIA